MSISFSELFKLLSKKQKQFVMFQSIFEENASTEDEENCTNFVLVAFYQMKQKAANRKLDSFSEYEGLKIQSLYLKPYEAMKDKNVFPPEFLERFNFYKKVLAKEARAEEIIMSSPHNLSKFELEATRIAAYEVSKKANSYWTEDDIYELLSQQTKSCLYSLIYFAKQMNVLNSFHSVAELYPHFNGWMVLKIQQMLLAPKHTLHLETNRFEAQQDELEERLQGDDKAKEEEEAAIVDVKEKKNKAKKERDPLSELIHLIKSIEEEKWQKLVNQQQVNLIDVLFKANGRLSLYFDANWQELNNKMVLLLIRFIKSNVNPAYNAIFVSTTVQEFLGMSFEFVLQNILDRKVAHLWIEKAISLKFDIKNSFATWCTDKFVEGCLVEVAQEHAKRHLPELERLRNSCGCAIIAYPQIHTTSFDNYLTQIKIIFDVHFEIAYSISNP